MFGRFWFYRRRRVLPFLAAYALVCINGATLLPLAMPASPASASAVSWDDLLASCDADAWKSLEYQRGTSRERGPEIAAALPPVVKNLRRHSPPQQARPTSAANAFRPANARIPRTEFMQRALVANSADLSRLCRLLL